jgi:hypothetical protein
MRYNSYSFFPGTTEGGGGVYWMKSILKVPKCEILISWRLYDIKIIKIEEMKNLTLGHL